MSKTKNAGPLTIRAVCPHCGTKGRVEISKLDRSFACGQCQKHFHMSVTDTKKGDRAEKEKTLDPSKVKFDTMEPSWFEKRWVQASRAAKAILIAVVVLPLVWYFAGDLIIPGKPIPEGLEERAEMLIDAVCERSGKMVMRLGCRGHYPDAMQWIARVRPVDWPRSFTPDKRPKITLTQSSNVRSKDAQKSGFHAQTTLTISVIPPGGTPDSVKHINTFWLQPIEEEGFSWKFDIKKTKEFAAMSHKN